MNILIVTKEELGIVYRFSTMSDMTWNCIHCEIERKAMIYNTRTLKWMYYENFISGRFITAKHYKTLKRYLCFTKKKSDDRRQNKRS